MNVLYIHHTSVGLNLPKIALTHGIGKRMKHTQNMGTFQLSRRY